MKTEPGRYFHRTPEERSAQRIRQPIFRPVRTRRRPVAIFGVGAFFYGTTDVSEDFLRRGVACVGWPKGDAPALHELLRHVRTGDIVYIKAHPPGRKRLFVKAVGVVTKDTVRNHGDLGRGVRVRWIWRGPKKVFREAKNERYNVRNNTLYEELSPVIRASVLNLLLERVS
jgi:hypothetical protein